MRVLLSPLLKVDDLSKGGAGYVSIRVDITVVEHEVTAMLIGVS